MTSVHLRYPRIAFLVAGLLAICVTPMVQRPWLAVLYLLPLAAALYIARAGTIIDGTGITARAMIGSTRIPWGDVAGMRAGDHGEVYALVDGDAQIRLPGARTTDLPKLRAASEAAATASEDA